MFDVGIQELIVIFIVALIVFGPKRLPELANSLGKSLQELKKAMEGVREQIHSEAGTIQGEIGNSSPGGKIEGTGGEAPGGTSSAVKEDSSEPQNPEAPSEDSQFYRTDESQSREKGKPVNGR